MLYNISFDFSYIIEYDQHVFQVVQIQGIPSAPYK
jgi:hypothetical protein